MAKQKGKPKHRYQSFLEDLLFVSQDFYFEAEIEPEVLADTLNELTYQEGNQLGLLQHRQDDTWFFELKAMQGRRGKYSQTAKAKGTIHRNEQDITIISGTASVGTVAICLICFGTIISGLLAMLLLMSLTPNDKVITLYFIPLICSLPLFLMWFVMVTDRIYLLSLIARIIKSSPKEKRNHG
jgi:hypothetical protein